MAFGALRHLDLYSNNVVDAQRHQLICDGDAEVNNFCYHCVVFELIIVFYLHCLR